MASEAIVENRHNNQSEENQEQQQQHFLDDQHLQRSPPPSYKNSRSNSQEETVNLNEPTTETQENEEQLESQEHPNETKSPETETQLDAAAVVVTTTTPPVTSSTLNNMPSVDSNRPGLDREDSGLNEITTIPSSALLAMNGRFTKAESNVTLTDLFERYEIGEEFGKKLECLKDYKIVFILDDSSSMKHLLEDSPLLKLQPRVARWNELQYFANIALQLANFYDTDGCDVHFLNKKPGLKNCQSLVDLNNFFKHTKPKVEILYIL